MTEQERYLADICKDSESLNHAIEERKSEIARENDPDRKAILREFLKELEKFQYDEIERVKIKAGLTNSQYGGEAK